jgi:hypothetical protein
VLIFPQGKSTPNEKEYPKIDVDYIIEKVKPCPIVLIDPLGMRPKKLFSNSQL